jgi:hypothetical protein
MIQINIAHEFAALPPEAKQQVVDFIEFLKMRYAAIKKEAKSDRSDEPFIGIWRDREDMLDSQDWVKNFRRSEWAMKDV